MRHFARTTLLVLWLFAIVAPSAITFIDIDNPIGVNSLNEEEQQELGKKNQAEEKFVNENTFNLSLFGQSQRAYIGHYRHLAHIDHAKEILLPPPEHIG